MQSVWICLQAPACSVLRRYRAARRESIWSSLHGSAQSALQYSKELLNAETAQVHSRDALQFLRSCNTRYDLVFVDPPFDLDLGTPVLRTLINNDLLNEGALVYVEQSRRAAPCWDPQHWSTHRERAFGESRAVLLQAAIPDRLKPGLALPPILASIAIPRLARIVFGEIPLSEPSYTRGHSIRSPTATPIWSVGR